MALADLFVEDDLDVSCDVDTYQDQQNPAPPLPGNYKMVVVGKPALRMGKDGKPQLTDGKFKTLTIQRAKIVEPVEAEKEFGIFADLRTKPFDRFGTVASDIADITRSMDQTRGWSGLAEGVALLEELIDQSTPFTVQLAWEAYDGAFVEQAFDALGISKGSEKKALASGQISKSAYDAIYKKARLGTKDFPVITKADGTLTLSPSAKGPSGATLEARAKIKKFFPSLEPTNLGPFRLKKAA